MKHILVVNVNWMGDVIFSAPVFKALKDNYPDASICCMAPPRVKDILKCIPCVDQIIEYDEDQSHKSPFAKWRLILKLRQEKFDSAFLLHRSLTRALIVYFAGIPIRVGYDEKNRGRFLTHIVAKNSKAIHRADHYLQVIEEYGIKINDRISSLKVDPKSYEEVKLMLQANKIKESDFLLVLNPGGNWDLKKWPSEKFSLLISSLMKIAPLKIVISGALKDQGLAQSIIGSIRSVENVIDLTGQMNLLQLMGLMERANLVISADSGPLHMANCLQTQTIGLYGPTRPEQTGFRGSGRAYVIQNDVGCNKEACYYLQCPDNVCMKSISVEDVLDVYRQIKN